MKKITILSLLICSLFLQTKAFAFPDVDPNTYYAESIYHLSNKGIINGSTDGNFYPNANVTRGQAAKIIARTLNLTASNNRLTFKDVPTDHEFVPYIAALAEREIIRGYSNDLYGMDNPMTREQVALVLAKAFDIPPATSTSSPFMDVQNSYAKKEIETLYAYGVTNGISPNSFGLDDPITRGSLAVLIHKLENLKKNTPFTLKYSELNAKSIEVTYLNDPSIIVPSNDIVNQKIIFTPIKAGRTTLTLAITTLNGEKKSIKYTFDNREVNNALTTNTSISTEQDVAKFTFSNEELQFTPTSISVKRANGTETKTVDIQKYPTHSELTFYATGQYIATFHNGVNSQTVIIFVKEDGLQLTGEAIFERTTISLTSDLLGYSLSNASVRVIEDSTKAKPISFTTTNNSLTIHAIAEGSTYLEIKVNNKTYTYIVEVSKLYGYTTIDIFEAY